MQAFVDKDDTDKMDLFFRFWLSGIQLLKVRVVSLYLLYGLYNYLPIQQNPFLCFLVDLYTAALHDDHLKPERFVTSIILNGDGEEVKRI